MLMTHDGHDSMRHLRAYIRQALDLPSMAEATYGRFTYDPEAIDYMDVLAWVDLGYGENNPAPIDNVVTIYRLEYVLQGLKAASKRRQPSFRMAKKMFDLERDLERRLDHENELLAFAIHLWANHDMAGTNTRNWRQKDAIIAALRTQGRHPFIGDFIDRVRELSGDRWASWEKLKEKHQDLIDREAERAVEHLKPTTAHNTMLVKRFEAAEATIHAAHTLGQKLVAFHTALNTALNTAHQSAKIAQNIYGRDAMARLDALSAGPEPAWDEEIRRTTMLEQHRRKRRTTA